MKKAIEHDLVAAKAAQRRVQLEVVRDERILVKEFIQGLILGLMAGFLVAWLLLS